ncbi:MAG: hypothetical protein P4L50_09500 [Anaerolineaceae bacterium]|nr:hypothetical protein [Anaerolineaceae bacterium]
MNKKGFTFANILMVILSLILAACSANEAAAQQATLSANAEKAGTPAAELAQSAKTAAANAQSSIAAVVTSLPATLQAAATNPATPAAAINQTISTSAASVQTAVSGVATALPTSLAETTPQPTSAAAPTIPVYSGFQPLSASDPKVVFWLNLANQLAKNTGFQFDGKAYVTSAKVADIAAFYNNALQGWKVTTPTTTSLAGVGSVTVWVYSQSPRQESLTISYSVYDPAASQYLVITELLWK